LSRSVFVSGATSSIGRAITEQFVSEEWYVYVHYHRSEADVRELTEKFDAIDPVQGDLGDTEDCKRITRSVKEDDDLEVLINNAAVFTKASREEPDPDSWDPPMEVNARAPWQLSLSLAEPLASNNGSIVNITDAATDRPYSDYLPYFASKGALETLTRGLARALSPDIRVNGVAPGPIDFPDSYSDSQRQAVIDRTLLNRRGRHEEIAESVYFLASTATYTTGNILDVDGGRHLN